MMSILLPAIGYALLVLFYTRRIDVLEFSDALLKTHITIFAFVAACTELLSLFGGITHPTIVTAWLVFLLCCIVGALRSVRKRGLSLPVFAKTAASTIVLIAAIAVILSATFVTALVYPPNTWDSMTYHMSRVAHWIANSNVSFYPTAIARQNYQMPLAEFAILHLQILTGTDAYANLVQWMSFLVLICLAALVARELGLDNRQQLISAVIVATLPMAILQASSTQNDLVASSFLMAFALFMLRLRAQSTTENWLFSALALGLAVLTKGTVLIYGAAIGLTLTIPVLLARQHNFAGIRILSSVVVIALFINAGHFWRTYQRDGFPIPTEASNYINGSFRPAALMNNVLRNAALHWGTYSDRINNYLYDHLHSLFGSQLNSPATTWSGTVFAIGHSRHEDTAGNPIHMLAIVLAIGLLPLKWLRGHQTRSVAYATGAILGALLFCAIFKWQPWASRLHTPLFALAAPLVAMTIAPDAGKFSGITSVVLGAMILYSLPFAFDNASRSLVSLEWKHQDRMQLFFTNNKLYGDYYLAMTVLREMDVKEAGLYIGGDDWEYPFWAFAMRGKQLSTAMRFRQVGDSFLPPYLIATKELAGWQHASEYAPVFASGPLTIFTRSEKIFNNRVIAP